MPGEGLAKYDVPKVYSKESEDHFAKCVAQMKKVVKKNEEERVPKYWDEIERGWGYDRPRIKIIKDKPKTFQADITPEANNLGGEGKTQAELEGIV